MKEIEFRGMSLHGWVYGYYTTITREPAPTQAYIWDTNRSVVIIPVESESIGQYTGLKDDNGLKIYEGDICSVEYSTVDGEPHTSVIIMKNPFDYELNEAVKLTYYHSIKIIGNVYEQSKIVKEEEK